MLSDHKHVMQYSHVAVIMPGGGLINMIKIIAQIASLVFLFKLASLLHVSTNSANFSAFG